MARTLSELSELSEEEMLAHYPIELRCNCLARDSEGYYCSKNLNQGEQVADARRDACDTSSLQMRCLNQDNALPCSHYQGEGFE